MTLLTKICGLSPPDAVSAARDAGATHLGFIFFAKSPRHVSVEQARDLSHARGTARSVAVTVDASDADLETIVLTMGPDWLQLHGSETPDRVGQLRARYGLPVMKALSVREAADLKRLAGYDASADMLLLDAKPPKGADLPGGNGVTFDWSLLDDLEATTPVLLSGGITLENIADALQRIASIGPLAGLDISSGVESSPGVKDVGKITALLNTCRQGSPA